MSLRFVSEPLETLGAFAAQPSGHGLPVVPASFVHAGDALNVRSVLRTWHSTKNDRGDTYLKRHWFELDLQDGRRAVVYFDRDARRSHARWWLYTITTA